MSTTCQLQCIFSERCLDTTISGLWFNEHGDKWTQARLRQIPPYCPRRDARRFVLFRFSKDTPAGNHFPTNHR